MTGKKLDLSAKDRAYLNELRSLSSDSDGREVLVGLTHEESCWLLQHRETSLSEIAKSETASFQDRLLELEDRHENARLDIVYAEREKRIDKPTMN